jgi:hypothetical protein
MVEYLPTKQYLMKKLLRLLLLIFLLRLLQHPT